MTLMDRALSQARHVKERGWGQVELPLDDFVRLADTLMLWKYDPGPSYRLMGVKVVPERPR